MKIFPTIHRTDYSGVSTLCAAPYHGQAVYDCGTQSIWIPDVRGWRFCVALIHELGHHVIFLAGNKRPHHTLWDDRWREMGRRTGLNEVYLRQCPPQQETLVCSKVDPIAKTVTLVRGLDTPVS